MHKFDRGHQSYETQSGHAPVNPSAGATAHTRPSENTPPQYTKGDNEQWT